MSLLSNYSPAEADWGIEEAAPTHRRFNSVSTADLNPPPRFSELGIRTHSFQNRRPSIASNDGSYPVTNSYSYGSRAVSREAFQEQASFPEPSTANFHNYIKKYLAVDGNSQITEKFKYNLIVSNLLDDTLVLSKNEQALSSLLQMRGHEDGLKSQLAKHCNLDGSVLQVTHKRYRLRVPRYYTSPLTLMRVINLCIFLLRQNISISSRLRHSSRVHLFKTLLIIATKMQKYRRAISAVCSIQSLRGLDEFMIVNCNINKMIISNMITLKEFDMFSFLNGNDTNSFAKGLKAHLNVLLDCLLLNTKNSVRELLPYSNGNFLEKYCSINNVPVGAILESEDHDEQALTLSLLTEKLTLFNNFRRFLICQLLTIHDEPLHNFFILKLCDGLGIDLAGWPSFVPTSHKLMKLQKIFENHTDMSQQLHAMNEKFRNLSNTSQITDFANDNILSKHHNEIDSRNEPLVPPDSELQLNSLIDSLQNLTTSLKYFRKYSKSIATVADLEEQEEKVSIFSSFSSELKSASDMYSACLNEYKSSRSQENSTASSQQSLQRGNCNTEQFNLKQFHTSKKSQQDKNSSRYGEKRTKRTSSGLSSGLLTVMEAPRDAGESRKTSHRNNSEEERSETCHQESLEALTRRPGPRASNRYSVASFNSNVSGISDLIASTHITTDDDIDASRAGYLATHGMPKEQLLKNLEDRFSRAYNIGAEIELTPDESSENPQELGDEFKSSAATDLAFLGSLERTLNLGITD